MSPSNSSHSKRLNLFWQSLSPLEAYMASVFFLAVVLMILVGYWPSIWVSATLMLLGGFEAIARDVYLTRASLSVD